MMNINPIVKYAAIGVCGLSAGYVVGYYTTKRRLLKEFQTAIEKEINDIHEGLKEDSERYVRERLALPVEEDPATIVDFVPSVEEVNARLAREAADKPATPQAAFLEAHGREKLQELVTRYQSPDYKEDEVAPNIFDESGIPGYDINVEDEEDDTQELRSVFDTPQPDASELVEVDGPVEIRDTSKPYIISIEDFHDDDDMTKISIVYYEDDDTLVDEREQVIPDIESVVGRKNLNRFGHKSQDENILYVRNEKLGGGTDFEIARNDGSYSHLVLGFEPDPQPRKNHRLTREDD